MKHLLQNVFESQKNGDRVIAYGGKTKVIYGSNNKKIYNVSSYFFISISYFDFEPLKYSSFPLHNKFIVLRYKGLKTLHDTYISYLETLLPISKSIKKYTSMIFSLLLSWRNCHDLTISKIKWIIKYGLLACGNPGF